MLKCLNQSCPYLINVDQVSRCRHTRKQVAYEFLLHKQPNSMTKALILFVAAGSMQEALAALREAQQPDTAAMFILAYREIHTEFFTNLVGLEDESGSSIDDSVVDLPGLNPAYDDVIAVGEYFGEYQRKLVHLCMDAQPFLD
ncbi:hypothetical protein F3Y22_tig00110540pilonHSYRG00018 [Hibiscus syriacus]|uniref:WDR11 TPR domain-containing protein n=1 Tax=Hibiscus syriacus TaxID=106335 RepID=A0A6A3AAM4_HIBSY|nr:hypothetical protein F3Y22_tig00110540pilonHSYRG00018 [Hibiscus syriacus]